MTTTATITYRKTRQGEWVVFGPATAVRTGQVTVTKKDGTTKTEYIARVGKEFTVNGITCRYGYIDRQNSGFASMEDAREYRRNRSAYSRRSCLTGGNCSSFGSGRSCGAPDCDGY